MYHILKLLCSHFCSNMISTSSTCIMQIVLVDEHYFEIAVSEIRHIKQILASDILVDKLHNKCM